MLKGIADLPLHTGQSPTWLFDRMKKLAKVISEIIVKEQGTKIFLKRLSEPYWFQSFACVLGFDWHSSGTTTVTMAALKEALKASELKEEIFIAGGKGKTSKKTPEEIKQTGEKFNLSDKKIEDLIKSSKLSAKVDNAVLQDGFKLYHHNFVFTKKGEWCVIQQGMEEERGYARRYHWLSQNLKSFKEFVSEPHEGIISNILVKPLNMVARESEEARKTCLDLVRQKFSNLKKDIEKLKSFEKEQKTLFDFSLQFNLQSVNGFKMIREHFPNILKTKINFDAFIEAYEKQPEDYSELALIKGMGPANIRALALVSNLIYGCELSWRDPCKFSFAHGGKDGWPYPVDKKNYDKNLEILKQVVEEAKIERKEKLAALRRLSRLVEI